MLFCVKLLFCHALAFHLARFDHLGAALFSLLPPLYTIDSASIVLIDKSILITNIFHILHKFPASQLHKNGNLLILTRAGDTT